MSQVALPEDKVNELESRLAALGADEGPPNLDEFDIPPEMLHLYQNAKWQNGSYVYPWRYTEVIEHPWKILGSKVEEMENGEEHWVCLSIYPSGKYGNVGVAILKRVEGVILPRLTKAPPSSVPLESEPDTAEEIAARAAEWEAEQGADRRTTPRMNVPEIELDT